MNNPDQVFENQNISPKNLQVMKLLSEFGFNYTASERSVTEPDTDHESDAISNFFLGLSDEVFENILTKFTEVINIDDLTMVGVSLNKQLLYNIFDKIPAAIVARRFLDKSSKLSVVVSLALRDSIYKNEILTLQNGDELVDLLFEMISQLGSPEEEA